MFETAEVGNRIERDAYRDAVPDVRASLLEVQRALADSSRSAVVIVGGSEGAGKEATVSLLLEWMDARGIDIHALWDTTDEERDRPRFWRFWRTLPPRGRLAILFGSWYTDPIIDRAFQRIEAIAFEREMHRIRDFERMLASEGTVLVKFWLHLSKDDQRRRLKRLRNDPRTRWRVGDRAARYFKRYDAFKAIAEDCVRLTSTAFAPWHVTESVDKRYRNLTVATTLLRSLQEALAHPISPSVEPVESTAPVAGHAPTNIIRQLDLSRALPVDDYRGRLVRYQGRLARLTRRLHEANRSLILVFEGPDAAGKGGAIRRLTEVIDPRLWNVIAIAAPTDEEQAHPYLWRFWRPLPRRGQITIYDRSWYGRVLVERVEGFIPPEMWRRAYTEINDFENQLAEFGTVIIKFWLAIGPEEQLERFRHRQTTPYKQYKITEEDWRNREKWDAYEEAACEMIERTSTDDAPWVLVEANDKYWDRIRVLKTVTRTLKAALG